MAIAPLAWRIQAVKRDVVREGRGLESSNQVA
jgi:hypothetical protein